MSLRELILAAVTATNPGVGDFKLPDVTHLSPAEQITALEKWTKNPDNIVVIADTVQVIADGLYYRVGEIENANRILDILPQVEEIIRNWTDYNTSPSDESLTEGPIRDLQRALGIPEGDIDGKFGATTSSYLLNYAHSNPDKLPNDIALKLEENFPYTYSHAYYLVPSNENALRAEETEHAATIDKYNQLIAKNFEACTGNVIDVYGQNPFGDILQTITDAYAQTAEQVSIAEQHVADAILLACKPHLDEISDPELKETLIANLANLLQQPLEDEINLRIEKARSEHESKIRQEGLNQGRLPEIRGIKGPDAFDT